MSAVEFILRLCIGLAFIAHAAMKDEERGIPERIADFVAGVSGAYLLVALAWSVFFSTSA